MNSARHLAAWTALAFLASASCLFPGAAWAQDDGSDTRLRPPREYPDSNLPRAPSLRSSSLSASGQVSAGLVLYRQKCGDCHSTERGVEGIGPSLRGVFNSSAGREKGFLYTTALKYSGHIWNTAQLDAFLANPAYFMPGTKMNTANMPDPEDRRNVIAYLMTLQ